MHSGKRSPIVHLVYWLYADWSQVHPGKLSRSRWTRRYRAVMQAGKCSRRHALTALQV